MYEKQAWAIREEEEEEALVTQRAPRPVLPRARGHQLRVPGAGRVRVLALQRNTFSFAHG